MLLDDIVSVYTEYYNTLKKQEEYTEAFSKNTTNYNTINNNFVIKQKKNQCIKVFIVEEKKNDNVKSTFLKKTFRKLSKIIHPDKNNKNSHLFIQSKQACDSENVSELIYISCISDLKDINIPKDLESIIQNELKVIKQKTNDLKSTISWRWNTDEEKEKERIRKLIKDI